jgi:hypothetical protein
VNREDLGWMLLIIAVAVALMFTIGTLITLWQ